jgi:hypothetical protein
MCGSGYQFSAIPKIKNLIFRAHRQLVFIQNEFSALGRLRENGH